MSIRLHFLGAIGGVTGSRTLLEAGTLKVLVDCGLFQGPKEIRDKNRVPVDTDIAKIQAVVLTHAHLDHSGYLPKFCREGFEGPIYCSEGTADLLKIMLVDAAHLEEEQAKYADKTGYSNHRPALPLFTQKDVELALARIKPIKRHEWLQLDQMTSIRFLSAGHIIGASLVQFAISSGNGTKILTFSGDLGHERMLTLKGPETLLETDALILESTYGDRLHPRDDLVVTLAEIIKRTHERKGVLVIPAFAVGRAQEMLYAIRQCEDRGLIAKAPVILDSPMSQSATRIFLSHREDHKDSFISQGDTFLPEFFSTTTTTDESMLSCMQDGPLTIISAAGMLNGGRILHHLKVRLPHEENTILFCGYQAEGTKGRFLQDNALKIEKLRIHHQEVDVNAEIATISSLSAHGDWQDFLEWFERIQKKPKTVLLNHGDPKAAASLEEKINSVYGANIAKRVETSEAIKLF